ncbi:MAG TPA: BREX-1 system adenine-specific DNA-methyltransferase PglX [Pantoea ananatis]|nr:BREX-1 system adenine-specific DNA-methyltransferase PglX [Pantoea ananatis]
MNQQENNNMDKHFYRASAADFNKIPGSPIAYWASNEMLQAFDGGKLLSDLASPKQGIATANNDLFLRRWYEVSISSIQFLLENQEEATEKNAKWLPYNKGGDFRKWYGNNEFIINWEDDGRDIRNFCDQNGKQRSAIRNPNFFFRPCVTWTDISSSSFGVRYSSKGFLFDGSSHSAFPKVSDLNLITGLLGSKTTFEFLKIINPTMHFQVGNVASIPVPEPAIQSKRKHIEATVRKLVKSVQKDWDSFELSWDFSYIPLLDSDYFQPTVIKTYQKLRTFWLDTTLEMQVLEEENNQIFIDAYSLHNELTPSVSLKEITLTCNPHYRYGGNLTDQQREERLQSDTIVELISYTIGCMMGRYSLDRKGLVYAHAGNEGFKTLVEENAYTRFPADGDGILPLTSDAWFNDDIAARVEEFIHTVWGEEHLEENLQFIADSLCLAAIRPVKKGSETSREAIRRYLSTQFFKDHLKTYKKRPIYWLFSSGKEKAFECLVYLHRYNEATLSRMRTEYVTPLLGQMASRIDLLRLQQNEAETAEAKRIGKKIDILTKQLTELRAFDDQLKHYADMKIQLNLDDGVKVNYGKFGTLLAEVKAITGDKAE